MADALSGKRAFSDGVRSQVLGEKTGTGSATSGPEDETRLFSARELEIFRLIGQGLPTRDVAGRLFLSVKTVEAHRENIKRKLGVKSAAALAQRAATWWSKQL
jgi:DNA-binding NarL/FixJ family response regulator